MPLAARSCGCGENDEDREVEIPETALPIVATECAVILPHASHGARRGNVISAAGAVFLDMVVGR